MEITVKYSPIMTSYEWFVEVWDDGDWDIVARDYAPTMPLARAHAADAAADYERERALWA